VSSYKLAQTFAEARSAHTPRTVASTYGTNGKQIGQVELMAFGWHGSCMGPVAACGCFHEVWIIVGFTKLLSWTQIHDWALFWIIDSGAGIRCTVKY